MFHIGLATMVKNEQPIIFRAHSDVKPSFRLDKLPSMVFKRYEESERRSM